jgi:hypothetical protein
LIWRRCSARETTHLATILQRTPAKKFHPHQPGPIDPDAFELPHLTHLLEAGFLRALQQGTTFGFQRRKRLAQKRVMRLHPQ